MSNIQKAVLQTLVFLFLVACLFGFILYTAISHNFWPIAFLLSGFVLACIFSVFLAAAEYEESIRLYWESKEE